jgi:tetratricopeptide (TPR) repeat protein
MGRRKLSTGRPPGFADRTSAPARAPHHPVKPGTVIGLIQLAPVWVVLAIGVWIAFSPALNNGFVDWDDKTHILDNDAFRGLGWEQIRSAFTTVRGALYQPVGWLVQSVTYVCFGLDPWGFHFISLLLHICNVVLLHLFCVRLLARSMPELAARRATALGWLCAIPAAIYAVHPLRAEPVAWAAAQAYTPCAACMLVAVIAYLRAHPDDGSFRRFWMVVASIWVALAVLARASAVVLPFVFLLLDAYPLERLGSRRPVGPALRELLWEKAPILLFCMTITAVHLALRPLAVEPEICRGPVYLGRVAQACYGVWFYLAKTIWPFGLTCFYPRPEGGDFWTPLFAACIVGIPLAIFMALWRRRRWPWLLATVTAYLVLLFPYLGLARVGVMLVADRYSYTPMMAWTVLGCAGLCRLADRLWQRPRPVLLATGAGALGIIGGLIALSAAQCRMWKDSEALWSEALTRAPRSSELHHHMGTAFAEAGKYDQANGELREALRIRPDYFDATYDLGVLLERRGETDAAVRCLREADRLRPNDPMVYLSLGGVLVGQGRLDEAASLYRQALRVRPSFANLHFNLGIVLLRQHKLDDAIDELNRAVELRPWYAEAYDILGGALVMKGRLKDAIIPYQQAVRLDPDDAPSRIDLGLTLARTGDPAAAVAHLREAVRRHPTNAEAHRVLGTILAGIGRSREAAAEFARVLRLLPNDAQANEFLARLRTDRRQL